MDYLLFETLTDKTLALLAAALFIVYASAHVTIIVFYRLAIRGSRIVSVSEKENGTEDVEPNEKAMNVLLWGILAINVLSFILLLILESLVLRLGMFSIFALSEGLLIGILLLYTHERLGIRVLLITTLLTVLTALAGYFGELNIAWLWSYLFFALIVLCVISFVRIFMHIDGWKQRLIAFFGIFLFVGFILYDFSALSSLNQSDTHNTWGMALDIAVKLFLDIINLFLNVLDLLSAK